MARRRADRRSPRSKAQGLPASAGASGRIASRAGATAARSAPCRRKARARRFRRDRGLSKIRGARSFSRPKNESAAADARPIRANLRSILALAEQAELRGIALRLGQAEMAERMAGEQPPARRALHEPLLDQI